MHVQLQLSQPTTETATNNKGLQYRHINRHFVFNKALAKRNKFHCTNLTKRQIAILLYLTKPAPNPNQTVNAIQQGLTRCGYSVHYTNVLQEVQYLERCGYLESNRTGKRFTIIRYNITLAGLNELTDFERILRNERLDK